MLFKKHNEKKKKKKIWIENKFSCVKHTVVPVAWMLTLFDRQFVHNQNVHKQRCTCVCTTSKGRRRRKKKILNENETWIREEEKNGV